MDDDAKYLQKSTKDFSYEVIRDTKEAPEGTAHHKSEVISDEKFPSLFGAEPDRRRVTEKVEDGKIITTIEIWKSKKLNKLMLAEATAAAAAILAAAGTGYVYRNDISANLRGLGVNMRIMLGKNEADLFNTNPELLNTEAVTENQAIEQAAEAEVLNNMYQLTSQAGALRDVSVEDKGVNPQYVQEKQIAEQERSKQVVQPIATEQQATDISSVSNVKKSSNQGKKYNKSQAEQRRKKLQ